MCIDPATAALISLGATVIGTGVSGYGAIQSGMAQQGQMDYQAAVNRNNAITADRASVDSLQQGDEEERRSRLLTAQTIGSQRVALAANGIDLGSDFAVDTQADTAMLGELDALTVRNNAERQSVQFQNEAKNLRSGAANYTTAGQNARSASFMTSTGSILGGASTVGTNYANFANKGLFGKKSSASKVR